MRNYEGGVGRKTGRIICKTNSLNYNVLIPNGDVQLCCMDYGLDAKIGNLLEFQSLQGSKLIGHLSIRLYFS